MTSASSARARARPERKNRSTVTDQRGWSKVPAGQHPKGSHREGTERRYSAGPTHGEQIDSE
jgi:hypothetical protein